MTASGASHLLEVLGSGAVRTAIYEDAAAYARELMEVTLLDYSFF